MDSGLITSGSWVKLCKGLIDDAIGLFFSSVVLVGRGFCGQFHGGKAVTEKGRQSFLPF